MVSVVAACWRKARGVLRRWAGLPQDDGVAQGRHEAPGEPATGDGHSPQRLPLRLTRRFAIICGAAFLIAAALLSFLYATFATRELEQTAERNNVAMTRLFQASIIRGSDLFAGNMIDSLRNPAALAAMHQEVVAHMQSTPVVKVKIYDHDGVTIFSTETTQIGEEKIGDEGVESALAGKVASELTYRGTYSSFENTVEHADLLSSYVPIRSRGLSGTIVGVFEVYSDVSSIVTLIGRTQILLTAAVIFVFALVFSALVWAVGHSDRVIRRQHEQAVALAFGALGRMTGGLAHDLNNLLTIVIGNLEALEAKVPAGDRQIERPIANIRDAAWRATQLARSLIAVARRGPLEVGDHDMNRLVTEMLPLIRSSVGPAVRLSTELDPGELSVSMDANDFGNVVLNLVINGRDALQGRHGGEVVLRTRRRRLQAGEHTQLPPGDYALLEVSDTGSGMEPEVVKRAFEPFFTTKGRDQGTGLGLAMVRGYAEQLKGIAEIESRIGVGTTVRLYLPLSKGSTPETKLA
jgi:signal transduction histidine kinase